MRYLRFLRIRVDTYRNSFLSRACDADSMIEGITGDTFAREDGILKRSQNFVCYFLHYKKGQRETLKKLLMLHGLYFCSGIYHNCMFFDRAFFVY